MPESSAIKTAILADRTERLRVRESSEQEEDIKRNNPPGDL